MRKPYVLKNPVCDNVYCTFFLYADQTVIEVWGSGSLTTLPDMIERLIAEYHSLKSFHASATGQVGRCG